MSAYQALYRKYRPQTFDDVSGQLAVTQTLKTQLMTGKMSHAYLFTGTAGAGEQIRMAHTPRDQLSLQGLGDGQLVHHIVKSLRTIFTI